MPIPLAARNFPVPEPHTVLLGAGVLLHLVRPIRLPPGRATRFIGGTLLGGGAAIAVAATVAAKQIELADPNGLVTTGPYAVSRNPMYEAWTAIYVGAAIGLRSAWPLILMPGLLALVHATARAEERALHERFGPAFDAYARHVPRYVFGHALHPPDRFTACPPGEGPTGRLP